jgi:hypothetical protein
MSRANLRRGSASALALVILILVSIVGGALATASTVNVRRGRVDVSRQQALSLAEAAVAQAYAYLSGTAPDGSDNGSWRTAGRTETLNGQTYSMTVANGAQTGQVIVTGTATVSNGTRPVTRTIRQILQMETEDVNVWNNALFAGGNQSGSPMTGNISIHGSVHIRGDGDPYTDVNGNGKWDSGEPYVDVWGDGVFTNPLGAAQIAMSLGGGANIDNTYDGMPADMLLKLPPIPLTNYNGLPLQSLKTKVRVQHGKVELQGASRVGSPNNSGTWKGKIDGSYVTNGYTDYSSVYSDNGVSKPYSSSASVAFPHLFQPMMKDGQSYTSHTAYLQANGLVYTPPGGTLILKPGTAMTIGSGQNRLEMTLDGRLKIRGIIYIQGNILLDDGLGDTIMFDGRGTLASTGDIDVSCNVVSRGVFPTQDALGYVAGRDLRIAQGAGDAQLKMMGAFYAQRLVTSNKQNKIAGSLVGWRYEMNQVPDLYQVPTLAKHLPPGMPGDFEYPVDRPRVISWREL